ncbi:SAM-dependent methyltransferase [Pararhizobium mangrovi]|uniref:Class I SAM-dependent methyltransferase n=1 Tax=Pararhizobium mangrovi TaxID=2590452 RepID=A0A506TYX3_9HYPH|nr:cyclopropane-fatty-acyl-phospholipid synthase family protein [Pararhizobium mangrovi]TPW26408.1 class I SAM-dependent methyltransferase [Pararhizobium mangrovi]
MNAFAGPADFVQAAEPLCGKTIAEQVRGLPLRARFVLKRLVHMRRGSLVVATPEGRVFRIEGAEPGPAAAVRLANWNLPRRALAGGTVGVAESYIDGDWESPDVAVFLQLFLANADLAADMGGRAGGVVRLVSRLRHWLNANTRAGSRKNIAAHYDLGNAFYEQWLDSTMSYSAALYSNGANDLASAQHAKYRALATAMGIEPGDHVLEIGCGWGGFAEYAAREIGCRVTGLTISREQHDFARARLAEAGLGERTEIAFRDYRDETGRYDHVVSIEMFEAVGEKYWSTYFDRVRRCLKPGGKAGLQVITINDAAFERYRSNPDFIQRYVFPGGMLPTMRHLRDVAARSELNLTAEHAFGGDYARTLVEWRDRFWRAWSTIRPLGFDERFRRMWEFYLQYCEAGFRARHIDVRQVVYE